MLTMEKAVHITTQKAIVIEYVLNRVDQLNPLQQTSLQVNF